MDEETRDNANDVWQAQWDFDVSSYSGSTAFSYLKGANTLGDYFESIGVSKSSFRDYTINTYRASEIFEHYYSEGGTEEVPKDDIRKWIDENYSLTRYFSISLKDSEGNLIEDEAELKKLEDLGFGRFPVCIAKTQYSLSDDPAMLGRPEHFEINVREVYVSAGAGFVVVLTGAVMTMPGLPKKPAAYSIDVGKDGVITGLF